MTSFLTVILQNIKDIWQLFFQGKPSPDRFAPLQETVEEEKTSNQYTEGLFSFHCSHWLF